MDVDNYHEVIGVHRDEASRKLLLKQIIVCSAGWFTDLLGGITYGTPTVMIPQIKNYTNATIVISENMEALLKSIFGYATIPWVCLLTYLTIILGRRLPLFITSITMVAAYILQYYSNSYAHILISEILQSSALAASCTVSVMIISEYAAPKYRGILLPMKAATYYWGVWISNALGTFLPWRFIPVVGIAGSLLMLPIVFFPESPSWLASKGRFEECRKAHRWIRGTDEDSEEELEKLIKSQEEYINKPDCKSWISLKDITTIIVSGYFYKPILLAVLLSFMYSFSGKMFCVMYSIDIIKKITNSEKMAYIGMLSLDGISLLGMYTGSAVSKYLSRRTLLFTSSFAVIIVLCLLSLYLYLIKLLAISENNFVSVALLALYSLSISSGIILMATTILGEILPLKYRSVSLLIFTLILCLMHSLIVQPTPYILRYFGLHGAFLFYGILSSIFTAICYKYLPETKDKTLFEIEEYFKDTSKINISARDVTENLLSGTELKKDTD